MAKELSVLYLCDLCADEADHVGISITIGTAKPGRRIDLCRDHYQELLAPVIAVVSKFGVDEKPEKPRTWRKKTNRDIGPYLCQMPGCISAPLKNSDTLTAHLMGVHHGEVGIDEYREKYGLEPLSVEELARLVVEARCGVEGCDKVYSTALGHRRPEQALRSHRIARHGLVRGSS